MRVRAIVEQLGLTMLLWNLDVWDWRLEASTSLQRLSRGMDTVGTWEMLMPAGPSIIMLAHGKIDDLSRLSTSDSDLI
jgi:hypothetical protein